MKTKLIILLLILIFFMTCLPVLAIVFDQHEEESGEFEHRVSTEGLSGISLILVNLYNDHRLIYAIVTTISMAIFGGLIALSVDFILARFGLTVSKMEHRE
jgi:hypothetical protein